MQRSFVCAFNARHFMRPTTTTQLWQRITYCRRNFTTSNDLVDLPSWPDYLKGDHYASVPGRALIEMHGADTIKFLQGLITNQMSRVANGGEGFCAAFLTPQGRLLADAFIYPHNQKHTATEPVFLIDCPESLRDTLMMHFRKYRLRSKIDFQSTDAYRIWSIWGPGTAQLNWKYRANTQTETNTSSDKQLDSIADIGLEDRRAGGHAFRVVLPVDQQLNLPTSFTERSSDDYTTLRILQGVAEGEHDFVSGQSLPLECNLDYMDGVDFRKGCYIGQELTIRTYHTGVVRKRLVPVQLLPESPDQQGTPIVPWSTPFASITNNKPVPGTEMQLLSNDADTSGARARRATAKLHSVAPNLNVALALVRLEHVQQGGIFRLTSSQGNWLARPWIPSWWPKQA